MVSLTYCDIERVSGTMIICMCTKIRKEIEKIPNTSILTIPSTLLNIIPVLYVYNSYQTARRHTIWSIHLEYEGSQVFR